MIRNLLMISTILFSTLGIVKVAEAGRIHFKAWYAQVLLEEAWQETLKGKERVRPWPWADTWPVARIYVPKMEIEQIVLSSDSGNSLAFGPGMKNIDLNEAQLISGHNDTHFAFLEHLVKGDLIEVTTQNATTQYIVEEVQVSPSDIIALPEKSVRDMLILTTCYPFNVNGINSDQRFVVFAVPVPKAGEDGRKASLGLSLF